VLIRAYGLFWNPEIVDWGSRGAGNRGELFGTVRIGNAQFKIDFWDVYGVYVLLENFRAVYVGKASRKLLGPRLRDHLTDRFAGRWDMFSWFALSSVRKVQRNVRKPGKRQVTPPILNDTLEALSILVTDAPLNRKRESIPGALLAQQAENPHPKTIRKYLEEILEKMDEDDD
jgi:hypothetical protein